MRNYRFTSRNFQVVEGGGDLFSKTEGTENSNSSPVLFDIPRFAGYIIGVNPPNPSAHPNCSVPTVTLQIG